MVDNTKNGLSSNISYFFNPNIGKSGFDVVFENNKEVVPIDIRVDTVSEFSISIYFDGCGNNCMQFSGTMSLGIEVDNKVMTYLYFGAINTVRSR
jgi:hypothetical protein